MQRDLVLNPEQKKVYIKPNSAGLKIFAFFYISEPKLFEGTSGIYPEIIELEGLIG